jgi:hypothetical protein
MAITISSTVVSIYLVIALIGVAVISNISQTKESDLPRYKANLTLMDFGYKEDADEDSDVDFSKSILAQRTYYSYGNKDTSLIYTIVESQYPWIIKFHENRLLNKFKKYDTELKSQNINLPSDVKVYSDSQRRCFVLVSENKVIEIKKGFKDIDDAQFLNEVNKKLLAKN